jgi:hypothetical protein
MVAIEALLVDIQLLLQTLVDAIPLHRPLLTTPLTDYTVVEGLLLLIVLVLVIKPILSAVWGWFGGY